MTSIALDIGQPLRGNEFYRAATLDLDESDEERLVRKIWLLALIEQAWPSGDRALLEPFTTADPLGWIWSEVVEHLRRFLPYLPASVDPTRSEVPPSHWRLLGIAHADLITNGVLIEVKTGKQVRPRLRDLHQLACLLLLDADDHFEARAVSMFWARWPHQATLGVDDFLGRLLGGQGRVDLTEDLVSYLMRPSVAREVREFGRGPVTHSPPSSGNVRS